jgi:serine/threonine-protein kinase
LAAPDSGLLPTGKVFHDHYEVVRCISTGAMGAVYEVIDQKTLRRRALKVMLPSLVAQPEMRERFKLEATITADIVSEHIVETFDADVDAATGAPFLVMELLRGDDLANILGFRRRLEPHEVVLILSQAARALDKTHAAGIVHRDLKPENIFITYRDDGSPRVKLLDFGIAKVAASTTKAGKQQTINLGTPPYMSPEQIMGEGTIDHRADLYALAHIAYALLVGEPYWLEESRKLQSLYTLLLRICDGAKEPASIRAQRYGAALPPAFDAWFQRATCLTAARRFERASEQVLTLAEVLGVPLETRAVHASAPDWELDSLRPSRSGLWKLVGSPSSRPAAMVAPVGGPASRSSAPPQGPRSDQPWARPDPTPHALQITPPPPARAPLKRRSLWLLAFALVFVGILVATVLVKGVRVPSHSPSAAAPPETTRAPAAVAPVQSSLANVAAPSVASSRSASPAVATSGKLPPLGKPKPTGTPPPKTQPAKPSTYDPLREL